MKRSKRRRRLILLTLVVTCLVVGVVVFKKLTKKPPQVKPIVTIQICQILYPLPSVSQSRESIRITWRTC